MATSEEDKVKFIILCYDGDLDGVTQLLRQDSTLIKYKNEETGEVNKKDKEPKQDRSFKMYCIIHLEIFFSRTMN